ncbi:hypothetical protein RDABS01_025206 [Bienertia sinuspersici]
MNQFSLNLPSSDTLWYTPTSMDPHSNQKSLPFFYHPSSLSLSNNPTFKYDDVESDNSTTATTTTNAAQCEATSSSISVDYEYMFEKPLTPSDVGKLNRLVIPKQHAEKYFPLSSSSSTSTTTESSAANGGVGGGGVLLGFEDESGKCWKFRYSYWNSSQSYVLTKGWSRYVKEKKLDAGDVVLFQRHRFEPKRFFIGWRRRGAAPVQNNPVRSSPVQNYNNNNNNNNGALHPHQIAPFSSYPPDCLHSGTGEIRQKGRKSGSGNSRRVRLFGVNLECQIEEGDEDEEEMSQTTNSDGSSLSSQGGQGFGVGPTSYNYFDYVGVGYPPNSNHYNSPHMDTSFPQDVNQMSNRLR